MRCLNAHLERFYSQYAYLIYRHAWLFIILPMSLTLCLSVGFFLVNDRMVNDTVYLVNPYNGKFRSEQAAILKHWPYNEDYFVPGLSIDARHFFHVIITAKDESRGLLHNDTIAEIVNLNDYLMDDLTVKSVDGEFEFKYYDVCLSYYGICFGNVHVIALSEQIRRNGGWVPVKKSSLGSDAGCVGYLIGDLTLNESDDTILNVGAIRLLYFGRRHPIDIDTMSIQWRIGAQDYLLNKYQSNLIHVTLANEDSVNQGLIENARCHAAAIALAFVIIMAFSFMNSFVIIQRDGFVGIDWIRSKPMLAFFGVTSPCLAIASTIGTMLLIGMPFNPVLVVMPFIVLAVGVNDMFIMMSAWHSTTKSDPAEVRFSMTLSDAAVSITITSVSDVVAFASAIWNPYPGVQLFCAYTSLGFFFELVYQCTYYAAAIALFAKAECEGRHCFTFQQGLRLEDAKTTFQRRFMVGTMIDKFAASNAPRRKSNTVHRETLACARKSEMNSVQKFLCKYYIPALLHPIAKFLAVVLFASYLGLAVWGCAIITSGLPPDKLMRKGHYTEEFLRDFYKWKDGTPIQVLVEKSLNVSLEDERMKMLEIAEAFENTSHSMDATGTCFWLREYMKHLNKTGHVIEDTRFQWCDCVKDWLQGDSSGKWIYSIEWGNETAGEDPCEMKAFRFTITTTAFGRTDEIKEGVVLFRNIADEYKEYRVSTYTEYIYGFADQYMTVNPTMFRNGIVAFLAMMVISMFMVPHPVCALFISLSTASIDTGVAGFLSWWGVSIDGLSMTTMIMATGFAVDLSAHVSYAYLRSFGTPEERVGRALEELGWPVFQGVMSTLLGVMVLGFIDSYMYQTFFKTVFLVIVFGIVHSLFFLPIALTVFAPRTLSQCRKWRKRTPAACKAGNMEMCPSATSVNDDSHYRNGKVTSKISQADLIPRTTSFTSD